MKNSFLTLGLGLLLVSGQTGWAQTTPSAAATSQPCAAYSGRITSDGKPLSGASVFVKGTSTIVITNEEGFFTLPAKVAQSPTLSVSAAGYAPQEATFTSCTPLELNMQILPGTRIKQRGKRKGFIMKTGQAAQ